MEHGIVCLLADDDGQPFLELYDGKMDAHGISKEALFTVLPESIDQAIKNKELMAQLGENILIRLAVANGIEFGE